MLKTYDKLMEQDERHAVFRTPDGEEVTLHFHYQDGAKVELSAPVPAAVREVFDRGRNAYFYSWFDYDLGAAAEMLALSALELGLRHRFGIENEPYSPGLRKLFDRAVLEGHFAAPRNPELTDAELFAHVRNNWMHGSTHVHDPGMVVSLLQSCADLLGRLFPANGVERPEALPG